MRPVVMMIVMTSVVVVVAAVMVVITSGTMTSAGCIIIGFIGINCIWWARFKKRQ
ncbi:hypothetical protein SAMN05421780_11189 [Flexibacter flexilis DSM 6793]|uniref:Uncharacterized protein n=2 Tax=Flexibacter flexilis TaxID=998 RepID=A0A1I1MTL1_9BACT|nr:hypothetical protein SAMN05421780_11189 [Flexibacter flexilis DSM 6793]